MITSQPNVFQTATSTMLMMMLAKFALNEIPHMMISIPDEDYTRLSNKYGKWAVHRAISACPIGDVECVESQAQSMYIKSRR